jgi:hypothetical protein
MESQTPYTGRRSIFDRMKGAAMLDVPTYEEVEADTTATSQAAAVVGIVAVAAAIGGAREGSGGIIAGLISAFCGWLIVAGLTYVVGTRVFKGTATWGELLRTLGFAQSPGVLYVLGIIPFVGGLARFAAAIWILVASIIAIRQALDFDTGKAVLTAVVSWLVVIVVMVIVGTVLGVGGAIFGAAFS